MPPLFDDFPPPAPGLVRSLALLLMGVSTHGFSPAPCPEGALYPNVSTVSTCTVTCPPAVRPLWSTPTVFPLRALHFNRTQAKVVLDPSGVCGPGGRSVGRAFLLEDLPALGHMQMSFAALFSYLCAVPRGASVLVLWELPAKDLSQVQRVYYGPLLAAIARFFGERGVTVTDVRAEAMRADGQCFAASSVAVRTCQVPPSINPYIGHCASWFATPGDVGTFRRFLHTAVGLPPLPLHNCCGDDTPRTWAALLYDRPEGVKRRFQNPQKVRSNIARFFARKWSTATVELDYYRFTGQREDAESFAENCARFAHYDLIVIVHGAAMANLLCARPCATVIEITADSPDRKSVV